MSRFLEYGVFVPDSGLNRTSTSSTTPPATGQWEKVGGKWVKLGPDGKPMARTLPASAKSMIGGDAQGGGSSGGVASWEKTTKTMTQKDVFGETSDDDGSDDGNNSPTIPRTRSNSSVAGSAVAQPTAAASRGGGGMGGGELEEEDVDVEVDEDAEAKAGGSGGQRRSGGSINSGGLTIAGNYHGNAAGTEEIEAATRHRAMLTPGMSRSFSADEVVSKFFGEDATDAAAANGHRGVGGISSELAPGEGENAACVGEAAESGSKGRGSEGGKHRRTGSGSSNPANSPGVKRGEGSEPVETRDVACQWDGSEMGDADEEDEIMEVELPDTPDCRALTAVLRLYDHAKLENRRMGKLSSRPGWGVEENIENWDGVYLDTEDRVVALDVDGDPEDRQAMLIGPLPVELSEMDHLEQLTMRRHRFKGRIPAEYGQLTRLTHLNLSNCRLIGFIPPSFGDLVNLVVLNLSWNFLSGDLPPELGRLTQLEELSLNSNAFSGAIPPEFGKLKKLLVFNAGHNIGLSGNLPPEMSRMTALAILDLRHNKIAGKIPNLFGRLTNLQQLWLQDNQLIGDIPAELARLPRLQMMHLGNNKLSGVIPLALRGHPRYRYFKILPGNFALGEKVAPNDQEIEAASRRKPSKNAMEHASAALAQSKQAKSNQQQPHRDSMSMSPPRGSNPASRVFHSEGGTDRRESAGEMSAEDARRAGTNRNSISRKLRGIKRIMGKKATPPTSPTGSFGTVPSPTGSLLRAAGGGGVTNDDLSHTNGSGAMASRLAKGKTFLEKVDGDGDDTSPDATASMSGGGTSTGGYGSPSSN